MPIIAKRFELHEIAGKGGMGTVFRARDLEGDQIVALKIVEREHANARFEREASLLAQLDHPGIVRYVAHGRLEDERMFLAMEWLDGVPLDRRLAEAPLPLEDSLALSARLARALAAAHVLGIVHRDVKPSNVILRGRSAADATLVDFGIARAHDGSRVLTGTGMVIGTPAYMAPEQARAERQVDGRADVFSLGCLLFECLCGRPTFIAEHLVAVLAKVLYEPAPRVRSLRPEVSRMVDDLVAAMLDKSPDARPSTCVAVANALETIAARTGAPENEGAPAAIGSAERRLATVLLARPNADGAPAWMRDASSGGTEELLDGMTNESKLTKIATHLGMTLNMLADGGIVGVLVAEDSGAENAARVVRCALELQQEVGASTIAIATGRAIVALEVPVGDAIDAAARILSTRTREGGVWTDVATASMVEEHFELARDGRGARVLGERAGRPGEQHVRTVLGKTTACVGRERELGLLEATFRECIEEPIARAVLAVAPPGIGKSRVQRELVARLGRYDDPPDVWVAVADPLMADASYALLGDLLRRVLGTVVGESLESGRRTLIERLSRVDPTVRDRVARFLGEVAGVPFDDADDEALRAARSSPTLFAEQLEAALLAFVSAELGHRPIVLILENVHWADAASLRLVSALLARANDRPLMVVALARPSIDEAHPRLWDEHRCQRMQLDPLLRKAAEKLARALLGESRESAAIDAIVRRADGNALFVEELARAFVEGHALEDLPPTIAAVTEARIASLPVDARTLLRAAAVFGERFWGGGVVHLLGPSAALHLERTMRTLERLELVAVEPKSRFADQVEYQFRHALVRDVAYAMLTNEDRTLGHALAAEWLQERVDDGALLAHHFETGNRPAAAATWYVRAAEQALAAHDFDAITRHAARAAACGATAEILAPARLAEAEACLYIGNNTPAASAAEAAVGSLERGAEKWFVAVGAAAVAFGRLGRKDRLLTVVDELERTPATNERSGRERAIARARAATQLGLCGELARCDSLLEGCEHEPGAANDAGVLARLTVAAADRAYAAGEALSPEMFRTARALFLRIGDRRSAHAQSAGEILHLTIIGAGDEAVSVAEALLAEGGAGSSSMMAHVRIAHATRARARGDLAPYIELSAMLDGANNPRMAGAIHILTAQGLVTFGRIDEAERHVESARAVSDPMPAHECAAFAVLARIRLGRGRADDALDAIERARAIGGAYVPMWVAPTLEVAHFEALEALGRHDEALAVLRAGVASIAKRASKLGPYCAVYLEQGWDNALLTELAKKHIPAG